MSYDYANIKKYTRSQVGGLTKHLGSIRFPGESGRQNEAMIDRAAELGLKIDYNDSNLPGEKFIFTAPRRITAEQTEFGKAWLKDYFFKRDGKPRGGKRTEYISDETLRIAKAVVRFEFVGVLGVAGQDWYIHSFLPIYRAYNRKGDYFDYAPIPWGQPVVMEG